MDFYNHLNFSLGNEDWHAEEQALRVSPGDAILCVTASGDRPLHLLMTDCAEIISIDMNRIQNYLLDLKIAALSYLDYEKYIAFLGAEPCIHRYSIFQEIKSNLTVDSASFWENNKKMIEKGVVYQGRTERFIFFAAKFMNLIRSKKIKTLFTFDNIEEQREYITKKWDTKIWRGIFKIFIDPKLFKFLLNDPGLNSFIDFTNRPGKYIYQRMINYLNNNLAKKSALLQLVLTGRILPSAYFPYLTNEGYKHIRRDTNRLKFHTGNIIDYINQDVTHRFDRYSLSDIASYMSQGNFEQLLQGMLKSAKKNARFCIREFMSKRNIPEELSSKFVRDVALEKKLEKDETNFVYRFMVGEIQK